MKIKRIFPVFAFTALFMGCEQNDLASSDSNGGPMRDSLGTTFVEKGFEVRKGVELSKTPIEGRPVEVFYPNWGTVLHKKSSTPSNFVTDIAITSGNSSSAACPDAQYAKINVDLNSGSGGKFVYLCVSKDTDKGQALQEFEVVNSGGNITWRKDLKTTYYADRFEIDFQQGNTSLYTTKGVMRRWVDINYYQAGTPIVRKIGFPPAANSNFVRTHGDSNGDLNQNAGGNYIWLTQLRYGPLSSLKEISVITGSSSSISCPTNYVKDANDLNRGAGGKYIFLCYLK